MPPHLRYKPVRYVAVHASNRTTTSYSVVNPAAQKLIQSIYTDSYMLYVMHFPLYTHTHMALHCMPTRLHPDKALACMKCWT